MASEAASYREDVEQARRRFAEFRQAHAVRSRLLEELWATAAKLARRDGITATARVLGVDRPSLQKWTDRLEPRASAKSPKSMRRHRRDESAAPAFMELLAASTATATSCVVEVESASGGKLRLDLKTIATSQLAELIRALPRRRSCWPSRRRCGYWWRWRPSTSARVSTRWPSCAAPSSMPIRFRDACSYSAAAERPL